MRVLPNGELVTRAVPAIVLLSYTYDVPLDASNHPFLGVQESISLRIAE